MPEAVEIDLQELEDLTAEGKTIVQAAEALGMHEQTLYSKASSNHEVKAALERGRARKKNATSNGNEVSAPAPAEARETAARASSSTKSARVRSPKARRGSTRSNGSESSRQRKSGTQVEGGAATAIAAKALIADMNTSHDALQAAMVELAYVHYHGEPSPKCADVLAKVRSAVDGKAAAL